MLRIELRRQYWFAVGIARLLNKRQPPKGLTVGNRTRRGVAGDTDEECTTESGSEPTLQFSITGAKPSIFSVGTLRLFGNRFDE